MESVNSLIVGGYIESLEEIEGYSKSTVKQHLAAIRMVLDYLVEKGIMDTNPAWAVRGPKLKVKKGSTPILTVEEAGLFFRSIDLSTVAGLRDRAFAGIMLYTFTRVSAVCNMDVEDYYQVGKRWKISVLEKGNKPDEKPLTEKAEEYLDAYIEAGGIADQKGTPLFRAINNDNSLSDRRLRRQRALEMVKRRARQAGLSEKLGNHSFRGTGLTIYLKNGGDREVARRMANHETYRTTDLYIHLEEEIEAAEMERIRV